MKRLLWLVCGIVQGGTYYVSPGGNDAGDGRSPQTAWQTIGKVNSVTFVPGDRILFQGGESFPGRIYFSPGRGGTAANPITLASYGNGKAVIDGGVGPGGFFAWNAGGINLTNLVFRGSSFGRNVVQATGVLFYNDLGGNVTLPHIYMDNVEVFGFGAQDTGGNDPDGFPNRRGGEGISIGGWNGRSGYADIQITRTAIHDNEGTGLILWGPEVVVISRVWIDRVEAARNTGRSTSPSGTQFSGAGVVLYNVTNGVVEHSSFHDNGARGNGGAGFTVEESDHITIQYNQSYHNRTGGNGDGDGYDLDGGTTDCLLQYNLAYGNDGAGYVFDQPPGIPGQARNVVQYNSSFNDGGKFKYGGIQVWNGGPGIQGLKFQGNMVYSDPLQGGTDTLVNFVGEPATGLVFQGNSFISPGGNILMAPAGSPGTVFQGNYYWTGGGALGIHWDGVNYPTVSAWSAATGQEK